HYTKAAALIPLTVAVLAGCSTMEPPREELVQAQTHMQSAKSENADNYAALSMKRAQDKITQAEKAMKEKEYEEAKRLAEQAAADARLAKATAQTEKLKQALQEVNKNLDALRTELNMDS